MESLLGGFDDRDLGLIIIQIGVGSAIAYIPLQIYTCRKWRGAWRIAAFVPLLLMVPVFGLTAYAFAQQSNLWPILLIFAAPVGTVYLVILCVIRRFVIVATRPDKRIRQSEKPS